MPTSAASESVRDPVETAPREALREIQMQGLRATLGRVLAAQPVGAERLREAGIESAHDVASLEEVVRLPFSVKDDLREHYPYGLLAVPREEVVRLHASSGTGGKPTVVAYTRTDLENWAEVVARNMTMAGVRPGMVVHNANGYGLFTGGLGFHDGAERLGATVVPVSGGRTARQAMLLQDLGGQVLVSTPSYALVIAQGLREAGIDPAKLALEIGLFGGEPWSEAMREQIEGELGIVAISNYGLSEMCGPGVAAECRKQNGLHIQEDHFLAEVVDPESGEPLPEGEVGELVFTTLTKEALPLIRFRTRDLGSLTAEPCACGRTTARIAELRGRVDDMLIVRGVNLFPSQLEQLLLEQEEVAPIYQLIVERPGSMDELRVRCEPAVDGVDRAALTTRLEALLKEQTGIRIDVEVAEAGSLPRSEGKAVRVVDRRT
jgi:phenylacetate-CoA ligase